MRFLLLAALIAVIQPATAADRSTITFRKIANGVFANGVLVNEVITNTTITQICLAAFRAAMTQAGKAAPPGMGADTCNCFLREVEQGEGLDTAQAICKAEAARKYNL